MAERKVTAGLVGPAAADTSSDEDSGTFQIGVSDRVLPLEIRQRT